MSLFSQVFLAFVIILNYSPYLFFNLSYSSLLACFLEVMVLLVSIIVHFIIQINYILVTLPPPRAPATNVANEYNSHSPQFEDMEKTVSCTA
jgi:hypothetical protein